MIRILRAPGIAFGIAILLGTTVGEAQPAQEEPQQAPAGVPWAEARQLEVLRAEVEAKQKQLQAEQIRAARAEQKAIQAEEQSKNAAAKVDELKEGKLMSVGLTGGAAAAVQFPAWGDGAAQEGLKVVAMPYIMIFPFYVGALQATREYCASAWTAGSEDAATAAAVAISRKRAERRFDAIITALRAGESEIGKIAEESDTTEGFVKRAREVYLAMPEQSEQQRLAKQAYRGVLIDQLSNMDWNPAWPGKCAHRQIGVWVGRPANYEVNTSLVEQGGAVVESKREVSPVVAFGLGYSPNAYFSVLAGLTVGSLKQRDVEGSPGVEKVLWAGTVALGGNLDLIGGIFK